MQVDSTASAAAARKSVVSPFTLIPSATWSSLAQLGIVLSWVLPREVGRTVSILLPDPEWKEQCRALFRFLGYDIGGGGGDAEESTDYDVADAADDAADDDEKVGDSKRGYAKIFTIITFAILANHVRRMIWPESVVGGNGGPIGMLKLATGSPEVFLRGEFEMMMGRISHRSLGLGTGGLSKIFGDVVGVFAGARLLRGVYVLEGIKGGEKNEKKGRRRKEIVIVERSRRRRRSENKATMMAAVAVLVWGLGAAEYAHARIAHVVAVGMAYGRLIYGGGGGGREALWRLFAGQGRGGHGGWWEDESVKRILGIVAFHAELGFYLICGVFPLMRLAMGSAVGTGRDWRVGWRVAAAAPRPWLAVVILGWAWLTGHVAWYSNKYFMGLQMYEMGLVGWWIVGAGGVLGWVRLRERQG